MLLWSSSSCHTCADDAGLAAWRFCKLRASAHYNHNRESQATQSFSPFVKEKISVV
jgi:hypothetical protein